MHATRFSRTLTSLLACCLVFLFSAEIPLEKADIGASGQG